MKIISDNGVSKVWLEDGWIYKQQPKFMTDNEIWCLEQMLWTGYASIAEQVALEVIRMEYIERQPVTNRDTFMWHCSRILLALEKVGIRHGDLTVPNVIVNNNHPHLIDFSESRLECDPRVDKRPEGDKHWLKKTMEELCQIS